MPGRSLSTEERALWARVTATVRALEGGDLPLALPAEGSSAVRPAAMPAADPIARRRAAPTAPTVKAPARPTSETLDGGWDRRLRRGLAAPERSVDLHGHTLASAHDALDHALERAVAEDVRLLLVVTGRPPREEEGGARRRGLIRAAIGDWLGASRHADRIAAVRNAHPRHGGAGALYIVLRRRRGG